MQFFFINLFVRKVWTLYSPCHKTVTLYTDVSSVAIYPLSNALSRIVAGRKDPLVIRRLNMGKHLTCAAYTSNSGLRKNGSKLVTVRTCRIVNSKLPTFSFFDSEILCFFIACAVYTITQMDTFMAFFTTPFFFFLRCIGMCVCVCVYVTFTC
uniref:Putative early e3b 10.4 kDa protein n=1 Tax=Rhipicephalus microplus TaxID=6941 RepID=A0A6M2D8W6_RHIMP